MEKDLNSFISKRSKRLLEKFCAQLDMFAKETCEEEVTLYEDAYTSFTLSNIRLENGCLVYDYDGREERDTIVFFDEESGDYYEEDIYGIADTVKFWKNCLRRAMRYWLMDVDKLDKIQNGEIEDNDED